MHVGLALSYVKLLLSSWKIYTLYVQFDGMVYQQIVGIPMGTNCAPLIADLFLYCYEKWFLVHNWFLITWRVCTGCRRGICSDRAASFMFHIG